MGSSRQSLKVQLYWPIKHDKDHYLAIQKIETINQLESLADWYVLIAVNQVIQNSDVMKSLAILSGGTSQRNLERRLQGKL